MARKKYEKTKAQVNVNTQIQSFQKSYAPLVQTSKIRTESLQQLMDIGKKISYDKFTKDAVKKAQRRAVDNDPYLEYQNTKDSMGLEDRLTNEQVLLQIGNDYITDLEIQTKALETDSLNNEIPSAEFNALVDRKVLDIYQKFRKERIDSPLLELEARKTIDPYIRRMKVNYESNLLTIKSNNVLQGSIKQGKNLMKFYGASFDGTNEEIETARTGVMEWLKQNPELAKKHTIELSNIYDLAQFESMTRLYKLNKEDLKNNSLITLQIKYNLVKNVLIDPELANHELRIKKTMLLKAIEEAAGIDAKVLDKAADNRINFTRKEFYHDNKDSMLPETMNMMDLIDALIMSGEITKANYIDTISAHNKTVYPIDISVKEADGGLTVGPMENIPYFRETSQSSLEAYALKRIKQYDTNPVEFTESLYDDKNNIIHATEDEKKEIAYKRKTRGLAVISAAEVTDLMNTLKLAKPKEKIETINKFFNAFSYEDLETLGSNMLVNMKDDDQKNFFHYLAGAMQEKLTGEPLTRRMVVGRETINNWEKAEVKDKTRTEIDALLKTVISSWVDDNIPAGQVTNNIRPMTTQNIKDAIRTYLYGDTLTSYGDQRFDGWGFFNIGAGPVNDELQEAFDAVTGKHINNEQVHGYFELGNNGSKVHINELDRKENWKGDIVSAENINDVYQRMDTSFMNTYMYIQDPHTGEMVKWEKGYSLVIHPLRGPSHASEYRTKIDKPTVKTIPFKATHARDMDIKNAKTNSNYYNIYDENLNNNMKVEYKGELVEVLLDLKQAAYDWKKYVEPNLGYVKGEFIDDDYLVEQNYINYGPGTISKSTSTKRYDIRYAKPGDIIQRTDDFGFPEGPKLKFEDVSKGLVRNQVEVRNRAKQLEAVGGTSFAPIEFGTKFQRLFEDDK